MKGQVNFMDNTQLQLPLIKHEEQNEIIYQRIKDGYVNATAMCKAAGKQMGHYGQLSSTKAFLKELSSDIGIPISELVQIIKGGTPEFQGTWVHPQVAIHLGQWASPKFAVLVSKWVFDWMSGSIKSNMPYHLRRYIANMNKIPNGYFSMLNELTISLIGPLEQLGYILPDNMIPDISMGKLFSSYLRSNGIDVDNFPTYEHTYEDGRRIQARAYPNNLIADLRRYFIEVWLKDKAIKYFQDRDVNALPYLGQLLALPNYRDVMGYVN